MSSIFGDFPESQGHKIWRWTGYFVIGLFFSVGPLFLLLLLMDIHHLESIDRSWHLPVAAWAVCAAWTAHMGMAGKLKIPNRFFSGLVYIGYILLAGSLNAQSACTVAINLLFPLLCIWFGDLMGGYTGYLMSHPIDSPTPGVIIAFMGWFFLIGVPIVSGIISSQL